MDNQDVAVLTKLNDLAERRGLKPYDFLAVFKRTGEGLEHHALQFELPASGNALREERYEKMLRDLGENVVENGILKGTPADIIDALDDAIAKSPRSRRPS